MTAKEQYGERRRQWARFNRWESGQPLVERPAADIVAELGTILGWVPREARGEDPDAEKLGIQAMRRALAHLGPAGRCRRCGMECGRGRITAERAQPVD
jgi:hypothetical protein